MSVIERYEMYCNALKDSNKVKRRNGLDGMLEISSTLKKEELEDILNMCSPFLITLLSDESEINRNKACILLNKFVTIGIRSDNLLQFAIPVLKQRIGGEIIMEESEENRLELICFLENLIQGNIENSELHFLDDISIIVKKCLSDKYPEVILKSCGLIEVFSKLYRRKFPMFSNIFVKPLLKNMNQKYKIRTKSIQAIGCIFLYGDNREFSEASNILLKYIFDIHQVKMELLRFGYSLACNMADRYSFMPKILPFVLFGLFDEDSEIVNCAKNMWNQIGLQYQDENKSSLPLKLDKPELPETFNIGCNSLIKRSFHAMLIDIDVNIQNWLADVRLMAIRLLSSCIIGLESNCIQYSDKILKLIVFSASDQDPRISKEALKCANFLGYHLPPDLYISIMKPYLWGERSETLHIFSALLHTTDKSLIKTHLKLFFDVFSFKNIDDSLHKEGKNEIFEILKVLFPFCFPDHFDTMAFFSLFYIAGSTNQFSELQKIMVIVSDNYQMNSTDEFYLKYSETFLLKLKEVDSVWIDGSPEVILFSVLARFQGFDDHLDLISEILKLRSKVAGDAMVSFAILHSLDSVIKQLTISKKFKSLEKWSCYLITEHINDHLHWKAGKIAQSLRMTAMSYLNSVTQTTGSLGLNIYPILLPTVKLIPELITDELPETRILSCKFIEHLNYYYKDQIKAETFLKTGEVLAKRLDDKHDIVRRVAAHTLALLSANIPYLTEFSGRVESLVKEIAVFTVEDEKEVQNKLFDVLENIKKTFPQEFKSGMSVIKVENPNICSQDNDLTEVKKLQHLNIEER